MKPLDTSRLVRYRPGFEQHIAKVRRRALWLWSAFAAWLLVLAWLAYRLGAP